MQQTYLMMNRLVLHIEGNLQVVFVNRGSMGNTIKVEDLSHLVKYSWEGKPIYKVVSIGISQSARDTYPLLQKGYDLALRYDLFSGKPLSRSEWLLKEQEKKAMVIRRPSKTYLGR